MEIIVEEKILNYLKQASLTACVQHPDEETDEYVLVEKTGSSTQDFITTAMFAIKSYSTTKYKAAQLNEKVKMAMAGLIDEDDISAVRLITDYSYPDTTIKKEWYQALFEIVY